MKYTETYDSTSGSAVKVPDTVPVTTSPIKPTLKIQKESIPSNLTLTEGTTLVVYVALSSSSTIASQFTIQLEGSAGEVASTYFNTTQSTLTIPAGETAGHVTILSLDDSIYHADSTWSLKLISHTTDVDSTDSLSFTLKDNDSNSSVAPTVILAGLPSDPSNLLSFNVSVSGAVGGSTLATYQYKMGPSLSTICSSAIGYSTADIASSTSIIENLGVYADGSITLCVIGKDASGNSQPYASATTYAWVKDTTAPTITSVTSSKANGAYTAATVIDIQLAFSEAVTVAGGTPTLDLNSNASAKANYLSGSGTSTLTFRYTVGSGHASADLNYPLTTSLSLAGSSLQDSVGNSAILTLPTVGGGSSLGTLKNLYIDTANPTAPSSIADGTWSKFTTQTPTISFTAGSDAESGLARHEIKVQDVTAGFVDVTTFATFTNNSSVSGLTLTNTKTYRVVLRAVDNAGNYSSETVSDGWTVDATAPIAPASLTDGIIGFSQTDTPTLSWPAGSDALSGVQGYQIAIGDTSGGSNVLDWTTVGNILTTTMSSLSLQGSKRYYTSVRTLDTAGGASATQAGDGWWNLAQSKVAVDSTTPTARMLSASAQYGISTAISEDGLTMIVGAPNDNTDATGGNLTSASGAAFVYIKSGGSWVLQRKLVGTGTNGRGVGDNFGTSVAISGDTVIVGAIHQSYDAGGLNNAFDAGAAYVFTRTTGVWTQQQKLVGTGTNGRLASDSFGSSVAISGDTVIVGAFGQDYNSAGASLLSEAGAAYVFTRTAGVWTLQQKLVGTGTNGRLANDWFGYSVAISGDSVIIGANNQSYDENGTNLLTNAGAAYVFTRTTGVWSQQQKLVCTGTNARVSSGYYGSNVTISGDSVIVGAYWQSYDANGANPVSNAGSAYSYSRVTTTWSQDQKLVDTIVPQSRTDLVSAGLGSSVAISDDGSTMIVGAPNDNTDAAGGSYLGSAGAAFIYIKSGGSWVLQQKLVGTGTQGRMSGDRFGNSVAISGDTVIVGANYQSYDATGINFAAQAGAAYIFTRTAGVWTQEQKLVGTGTNGRAGNDQFGNSVAISGDTLIVGAYRQNYDAAGANPITFSGAAYVFTRTSGVWSQQQKLVGTGANGRVSMDYFGNSVAISGDTVIAGAVGQGCDAAGANYVLQAGAAYVFTRTAGAWTQQQKLVGTGTNGRVSMDLFGYSVAISGDTVIAGAVGQDYDAVGANFLDYTGAAYVFIRTTGVWTQEQKLVGTGANGRNNTDYFGSAVAVSENGASDGYTFGVGATGQSYTSTGTSPVSAGAGAVFVFY
jgi:hypothetical protein